MSRGFEIMFTKEYIEMANRHLKRYSMVLIIREMHFKTKMRNHLTLIKITNINGNGKGMEKRTLQVGI